MLWCTVVSRGPSTQPHDTERRQSLRQGPYVSLTLFSTFIFFFFYFIQLAWVDCFLLTVIWYDFNSTNVLLVLISCQDRNIWKRNINPVFEDLKSYRNIWKRDMNARFKDLRKGIFHTVGTQEIEFRCKIQRRNTCIFRINPRDSWILGFLTLRHATSIAKIVPCGPS